MRIGDIPHLNEDQKRRGPDECVVHQTKKEIYLTTASDAQSREADLESVQEARIRSAEESRKRDLDYLEKIETEHDAASKQKKDRLDEAELTLEEEHRSASEHCAEIGVQYVPGSTSEADILRVTIIAEAVAAVRLGLRFGVGVSDRLVKAIKPFLTVFSLIVSTVSLGLGFKLLDAKRLFANPANLGISVAMGGVVSAGILVVVTMMWKPIGCKIASLRPDREVIRLLIPIAAITAMIFFGMAFLDGQALVLMNAARAALNPALAISLPIAMLIGAVMSGTYVVGLSAAAFAEGYTVTAGKAITGEIQRDANEKQKALKQSVPHRRAIASLAHVRVAEEKVLQLRRELEQMDARFRSQRTVILASLAEVPTSLKPEEIAELAELRERERSAKAQLDAHELVRSRRVRSG